MNQSGCSYSIRYVNEIYDEEAVSHRLCDHKLGYDEEDEEEDENNN